MPNPPSPWSSPAATPTSISPPAHGTWTTRSSAAPSTTPPAKPSTRSPSCSASAIPAVPGSTLSPAFGNPHAVPFSFAQIKTKVHLGGKPPRTKAAKTAPIAASTRIFSSRFRESRPPCCATSSSTACAPKQRPASKRSLPSFRPRDRQFPAKKTPSPCPQPTLDLIASFQHAVVGDLMKKTFAAPNRSGAPHPRHRRRGRQPRACASASPPRPPARPARRLPHPGSLHRQRRHDRRRRLAALLAGDFARRTSPPTLRSRCLDGLRLVAVAQVSKLRGR
jgi:hypothetical protein